jgi:hypothetical protein
MSNKNELLSKVIDRAQLAHGEPLPAGGGLMGADEADRFIDYMWNSTSLASEIRTVPMVANEITLDRMAVGQRLLRLATEAVDDGVNVGVAFSKISMTTQKFRMDWEISTEALEDNIERAGFEDHVARLLANQLGNDLEDLAINGDSAQTTDPLMKGFDGYRKRGLAGGHVVDAAGAEMSRDVMARAIRAMPRQYLVRRGDLRAFAGNGVIQDYLYSQQLQQAVYVENPAQAQAAAGAYYQNGNAGYSIMGDYGIRIKEVPLFNEQQAGDYDADPDTAGNQAATGEHGELWLTFPKNLLWGVKREVTLYRRFQEKKDSIEFTLFTRVGANIENVDAFVIVRNIQMRAF